MDKNFYFTWAINVRKNIIRKNFITNQLKNTGVNFKIFEAITPFSKVEFKHYYNPRRTEIHYGRPLMPTELACALSHISLWKKLINQDKYKHFLIFEDDVIIDNDINNLLKSYDFSSLDLVKFSGQHQRPEKKVASLIQGRKLYRQAYGPLDASGYLISKNAAKKILPHALKLNFAIDVIMDRSFEHKVPIYAVKPYPVISEWHNDPKDPLYTDIGVRTYKYSTNRSFFDRLKTKLIRIKTSYYRRLARLKLFYKL